jgi:membrane protein YqaA with SNARE-associated domain
LLVIFVKYPDIEEMAQFQKGSGLRAALRRWRVYHVFYRRTGFYQFVLINVFKVAAAVAVLVALFLFFQEYIIDYRPEAEAWLESLRWGAVFIVFFISESLLGLLPPDFFILWAYQFDYPYLAVTVLALLSTIGGIVSYYLGRALSNNDYIRNYLSRRYERIFRLLKQWGGLFVVAAALFPIPYSMVCVMVGIVRFPRKAFLWYASTRILRFYFYALVLFAVLN